MSILTETLADKISVCGAEVGIKTDFRVWLRFGELLKSEMPFYKKITEAIELCVEPGERLPADVPSLFEGLCEFYFGKRKCTGGTKKRVMDTECDAEYIFAAFYQQYGVDLTEEKMHWQKFRALLAGLSEDTCFMRIVGIRAADDSGKNSKELKRLKEIYALPISSDTEAAETISEAFR